MRQTQRLLELFAVDIPIVLAPMAGASTPELVAAVSNAGGLGSYGCARLSPAQVVALGASIRTLTNRSFNLNFFCHEPPEVSREQEQAWQDRLAAYYAEFGVTAADSAAPARDPFSAAMCDAVIAVAPKVVSFHFGQPAADLLRRLKGAGCIVCATATSVAEAQKLADSGCDVIVAQGVEAGGHRGMFLTADLGSQIGTFALVPQIRDAVSVPVIASGGISDARGVAAAFALGADAVQPGTAYLFCPEAKVSPYHRRALENAGTIGTRITNVYTGRPARSLVTRVVREVGPMSELAPAFPTAANALAPLAAEAERRGASDFTPMWAGQAASLGRSMGAGDLTRELFARSRGILDELAARAAH